MQCHCLQSISQKLSVKPDRRPNPDSARTRLNSMKIFTRPQTTTKMFERRSIRLPQCLVTHCGECDVRIFCLSVEDEFKEWNRASEYLPSVGVQPLHMPQLDVRSVGVCSLDYSYKSRDAQGEQGRSAHAAPTSCNKSPKC